MVPSSQTASLSASPRAAVGASDLPATIDGEDAADALVIDATDPGFLRGDGVFEVVRLYQGVALCMREHLERLSRSAAALALLYDEDALESEVSAVCQKMRHADGYLRIVVTRLGRRLVMAEPPIEFPKVMRLLPVEHAVSPLTAGIKALSYAANCRAKTIAEAARHDDALLVERGGRVLELPFASFAAVFERELTLPPLQLGVLDSITRRLLEASFEVTVREFALEELREASEACVIGTGMEICPVSQVVGVADFDAAGPVLRSASLSLSAEIRNRLRFETQFRGERDHG